MNKKMMGVVLSACILMSSVQVFGATTNQIAYINTTKIDEVGSTQVSIDNTNYDLKAGQYFTIMLENAEFDLDKNKKPTFISDSFDFEGSSKKWLAIKVKDHVTEGSMLSFSFHSKVTGAEAKLIIDPEDSGISGGTYVYATTGGEGLSSKGKIERITPIFSKDEARLLPIVITEQATAAFRSIQMYNTDDKPLITLAPDKNAFRIRNAKGYEPITFIVDDGDDNEKRYELGRDPEVELDYDNNKLTFGKADYDDDDIFGTLEKRYTVTIENIELLPIKGKLKAEDIKLVFGGELLDKQTIILGNSSEEPLKLEVSEQEVRPGSQQKVKFKLEELELDTLFKKGYINLGFYGGVTIEPKSGFTFKMDVGDTIYTEKENRAFKLVFDPMGDRLTIEGYRRNNTDHSRMITIEGELTVNVPEGITNDIEFFINEPSLSKAAVKTVLEGTDKPKQPTEPEKPEDIEEPVESTGPKVEFQIDNQTYTVGGMGYLLDMKPYISPQNRIMVPFRYVAYALGVDTEDLKWNGPSQTITLAGDKAMTINVATGKMVVDGETSTLSEVRLFNNRTFVPVGEIGRAFGVKVNWDAESRTATFN